MFILYLLPPLLGEELPLEPLEGADLGALLLEGADIDPEGEELLDGATLLLELLPLRTAGELGLLGRGDTLGEVRFGLEYCLVLALLGEVLL